MKKTYDYINPSHYTVKDENYPAIKERIINRYSGTDQYAFEEAVGKGPECVFVSRTAYQWFLQETMNKYQKAYQSPVGYHGQ